MRLLLCYSSKQMGQDPAVPVLCACLRSAFDGKEDSDAYLLDVDINDLPAAVCADKALDVIVVWNCLEWFMENRLRINSRTWNCAIMTTGHELVPFVQMDMAAFDTGLNLILSNCSEFVKRMMAGIPVAFSWKAESQLSATPNDEVARTRKTRFGCVIPNVSDRDFSQLAWTHDVLSELGQDLVIYLPGSEKMALPSSLTTSVCWVDDYTLFSMFWRVQYYVPAFRITDYRFGIMPSELTQAMHCGCIPLLVSHPHLEQLGSSVTPQFVSLEDYREGLKRIVQGEPVVTLNKCSQFSISPDELSAKVHSAYVRKLANA